MIVKLQCDLDDADGPMLVYNETRSLFMLIPSHPVLKEKLGSNVKGYFKAEMVDGKIRFGVKVEGQAW